MLKPGGYVLAFAGTRTWDIMSIGIRAAGFENRDTVASMFGPSSVLQWVHGQGFPKSLNIAKAIAKLPGDHAEEAKKWEGWGTALKPAWEPVLCFRKPVEAGSIAEQVATTGTGGINIDGTRVKHANAADLESHKSMVAALKAKGGKLGNSWKNSSDLSGANEVKEAGRWPANVAMVHSEECRKVGTQKVPAPVINRFDDGMKPFGGGAGHSYTSTPTGDAEGNEQVDVYECVEGCPVRALNEQSGDLKAGVAVRHRSGGNTFGGSNPKPPMEDMGYGDAGGASRFFAQFIPDAPFFYSAKASRSERNKAFDEKPAKGSKKLVLYKVKEGVDTDILLFIQEVLGEFLGEFDIETERFTDLFFGTYVPESLRQHFEVDDQVVGNDHPTVKPIALMSHLVKLVTPKGGLVLDPYCGSGTTCQAATEAGMLFTGIEKDDHFFDIAYKRVMSTHEKAESKRNQEDLFSEMENLP